MNRSAWVSIFWLFSLGSGPLWAGPEGSPQFDIVKASSTLGDAWLFGGGDPFLQRVRMLRTKIDGTLALTHHKYELDALCDPARCTGAAGSTVCRVLEGLNEKQRNECRAFLVEHADALVQVNKEASTPVLVSAMPLTVPGPAGASIPAGAMTQKGPKGAIVLHYDSVSARSDAQLMALLLHELGHKVPVAGLSGRFIDDNHKFRSFPSGRAFLDAIGAALAVHSEQYLPPPQEPPALPPALVETACAAAGPGDAITTFLVGLSVDATGRAPGSEELARWRIPLVRAKGDSSAARLSLTQQLLAGTAARGHVIQRLFRELLGRDLTDEERTLMVERLGEGIGYDAIVASIVGDDEYAKARGVVTFESYLGAAAMDLHGKALSTETLEKFRRRFAMVDRPTVAHLLVKEGDAWRRLGTRWYRDWLNREAAPAEVDAVVAQLKAGASWEAPMASLLAGGEYAALQSARLRRCPGRGLSSVAHR